MYEQRIKKIKDIINNNKADAFFVTNPKNIYYLSGFISDLVERESALLITKDENRHFISRIHEYSLKNSQPVKKGLIKLNIESERSNLLYQFNNHLKNNAKVLFESIDIRVNELKQIREKTDCHLISTENLIEDLRIFKDSNEIENIIKAVEITDKTFEKLIAHLQNNDYSQYTEQDIAELIRQFSRELDGEGFGFEPIVAFGVGSAEPHYKTNLKKLETGQPLLLDFGIKYKQYSGDLTRTVFLGKASDDFKNKYNIVLAANQAGLAACQAGIIENKLFDAANDIFKKENLDIFFLHGLGHGIGLDIHERPYLRAGGENIIQENMALTIEPGLYFENKHGIRIEDYVLITKDGIEILSKSPKELIEI